VPFLFLSALAYRRLVGAFPLSGTDAGGLLLRRVVERRRRTAAAALLGEPCRAQGSGRGGAAACVGDAALAQDHRQWRGDGDLAARHRFGFRFGARLTLENDRCRPPAKAAAQPESEALAQLRTEPCAEARRSLIMGLRRQWGSASLRLAGCRARAERLAARVAGTDYATLVCAQSGLERRSLQRSARSFLAATRDNHFDAMRRWWSAAGAPVAAADLAYLLAWRGPDGGQPQIDLQDLARLLTGLANRFGCRTEGIRIDDAERAGKSARPFAAPVDPPREVVVSVRPTGSFRDASELFHELGHGLAFAGIDPSQRWEFRLLWHDHVQETFAFIASSLLQNPDFVASALGASAADSAELADHARFCEVHLMRRHAALSLLVLGSVDRRAAFPVRYARFMEHHTGVEHPLERANADVEPELGSCSYFAAWLAAARAVQGLRRDFGAHWWEAQGAWARLRGAWRKGGGCSEESFARITAGSSRGAAALTAQALGNS
jgi:hypothetical protein